MNELKARSLVPAWATAEIPAGNSAPKFRRKVMNRMSRRTEKFIRDHMLTVLLIVVVCLEGMIVSAGTAHRVRKETEDRLAAEYAAQLEAYKAEQARQIQAEYFLTGEASREAAMNQEADAIARAIGPMKTKRMKMTMCWNILARVDNSAYPGSVKEVVEQPQQWMFYTADNPIREDDREIALKQLRMWHEGRYPSGLTTAMVYAEWSENDYVLRDTWEKTSSTNYWRMPE